MKILSALLSNLLLVVPAVALAQAPVTSVPSVDLVRYSGKWFEIASFPMFFQRKLRTTAQAPATLTEKP